MLSSSPSPAGPATAELTTCLDESGSSEISEFLSLDLAADETIFLVVDGYANLSNVAGAFEFSIGPGCVPTCGTLADDACGEASDGCGGGCACSTGLICEVDQRCATPEPGDTCAGAIALTGALPIQVSGSTESGFGDDYTICSDATDAFGNPVGELSPDVVPVTAAMMSAMMGPVPEDDREVHEDRVHRMR